jgi:hypothetical protein
MTVSEIHFANQMLNGIPRVGTWLAKANVR